MVEYDPSIIREVIQRLDSKAKGTVIFNALLGIFVGGAIGSLTGFIVFRGSESLSILFSLVLGFCIGNEIGLSKSLAYKFQAQMLLTQVEIERNTRKLLDIRDITSDIDSTIQNIADVV